MASPYQQQGFQRKLIYLGCILALFTGAWGWRQYVLADQAKKLGVREVNVGEVEVSGELMRLTLTGSRGVVTCVLWMMAIDDQRKNQWNELEEKVDTLTQLQPHFITPWLFQSWNLSYNVSVSLDRTNDKYFYIGRGIQLLAKGERQNRYNPELRWTMGFTYQHKICQHDETNVLRSLFQLSSIPPHQRDPNRFWVEGEKKRKQINFQELEAFCKDNPQLIRRLNKGIQRASATEIGHEFICQKPEALVQFLADNFNILSPYETPPKATLYGWRADQEDRLKDVEERYPVLPPPVSPGRDPRPGPEFDPSALNSTSLLNDSDEAYRVAQAWYCYSLEPLPPPGPMPGESDTKDFDRVHQRIPKNMMTSIFRQYPALCASFIAERLQEEGWFDDEPWPIPTWFLFSPGGANNFTDGTKAEVRIKTGRLSREAWKTAFDMWSRDGHDNHMLFEGPSDESNKKKLAEKFAQRHHLPSDARPPTLREEDLSEEEREEYLAARYMWHFQLNARVTNFHHHYERSRVEQEAETVQARKLFYKADTLRLSAADSHGVQRLYEQPGAMPAWRAILLKNEEFRKDGLIQEDTAEVQLKYFDLVEAELRPKIEKASAALPLAAKFTPEALPRSLIKSPFLDDEGKPIVTKENMENVERRRVLPGQPQKQSPGSGPGSGEAEGPPRPGRTSK